MLACRSGRAIVLEEKGREMAHRRRLSVTMKYHKLRWSHSEKYLEAFVAGPRGRWPTTKYHETP